MTHETPVAETYHDTKKLLYHLCHQFRRRFGGDFEELLSEAHLAFMSAYETFNSEMGQFSTLVGRCVRNRLIDAARKENKHADCRSIEHMKDEDGAAIKDTIPDKHQEFDLDAFSADMSNDCQFLVQLALNPTKEVRASSVIKGNQPRNWRSSIREYLLDMGWSVDRVNTAFSQLKEVV